MKLIVGLGNPGSKYEMTKHNLGFLCVDALSNRLQVSVDKKKKQALIGKTFYKGEAVILAKPQMFMNRSGIAVEQLLHYFDIDLEDLLVIYDDIDIEFGTIRMRKKGSAGTHNGMRDIVRMIASQEFSRMRLGIGRDPRRDLIREVISDFSQHQKKELPVFLEQASDAALCFVEEGIDLAMSKYNGSAIEEK